jgi:hypothetical protein
MIRVGFFETNRGGLGQRPDGESRHSLVPGTKASLVMYTLAAIRPRPWAGCAGTSFLTIMK